MSAETAEFARSAGSARSARSAGSATTARRRVATAVVAAATVSGLALTAVPAFADDAPPPPAIGHAVTDALQHGRFSVPVWSEDPAGHIVSVTAVLRDGATPVGDPLVLVPQGDTGAAAETWTLPDNGWLKLTEDGGPLPHLGAYAIDVTATDADGATVGRTDAGTLDFTLIPRFAGDSTTFAPASVDFPHRDLTVSGTLIGEQPGSGDMVPLAGRDVVIDEQPVWGSAGGVTATLHATTDADGHYAAHVTVPAQQQFTPRFTEHSAQVDGTVSSFGVPGVNPTAVRVTGTADHTRVLPGGTFKVSGTVTLWSGTKAPVAGAPVSVGLSCYGPVYSPSHTVNAVTDAAGRYTATVVADPECTGDWYAGTGSDFLTSTAGGSGHVAFPDVSGFAGVSSAIAADGTVTVTGRLLRTYHRDSPYAGQNTFLWYSHDGKTGWIRLKGANTASDGSFRLVHFGYVDGYYQVRHTDTDQLAASNGPIVRLNRIDTRVVSLRASATRVKKNAVITVSGTLQSWTTGAWRTYARQHVELFFQPRGKTTWQYKGSGTTAANGSVGFRPRVTGDGKWLIQYFGDSKHFDSGATAVYVDMI